MARMPAFLEALSQLDGRPFPSLEVYATHLRRGGYIARGSRGMGSAHVTSEDAAALLIATLATDSPTASPRVVEMFMGLKPIPAPAPKLTPRLIEVLACIPTLGEFVVAALENAGALRFALEDFGFELQIGRTVPAARLVLRDPMGRRTVIADWVPDVRRHGYDVRLPDADRGADRRITAAVTHRSFYTLGSLIEREGVEAA